uniref:Uncharacterized protein n=1 Tax=Arundo donax TaxID=35708 RepID=A0A0A9G3X5_ARUDO
MMMHNFCIEEKPYAKSNKRTTKEGKKKKKKKKGLITKENEPLLNMADSNEKIVNAEIALA